MSNELREISYLDKVDWVSQNFIKDSRNRWLDLFKSTAHTAPTKKTAAAKEILLGVYKPFINYVQEIKREEIFRGKLMADWNVSHRFVSDDTESEIKLELYVQPKEEKQPIKVLSRMKYWFGSSKEISFNDHIAVTPPSPAQVPFVTVPIPQFPKVIAEIDLSATDVEIKESIKRWREELQVSKSKDSINRNSGGGRPTDTKDLKIYFFDSLMMFQLGFTNAKNLQEIQEIFAPDFDGLIGNTFDKQLPSLIDFLENRS